MSNTLKPDITTAKIRQKKPLFIKGSKNSHFFTELHGLSIIYYF